jgi:hypothetical protein
MSGRVEFIPGTIHPTDARDHSILVRLRVIAARVRSIPGSARVIAARLHSSGVTLRLIACRPHSLFRKIMFVRFRRDNLSISFQKNTITNVEMFLAHSKHEPFSAQFSAGNGNSDHIFSSSRTSDDVPARPSSSKGGTVFMKAKTRRQIETGRRVLAFSLAHRDPSPGYATTLGSLQELLARAELLISLQRDRIAQVRGSTVQKRNLRRIMRRTQLMHLARVARGAAKENPELAQKFVLRPEQIPYLEFQATARAMLAEAQNQKELLVKHGLAETLLEGLVRNVNLFDQALGQSTEARRGHVGASAELDLIGDEIIHLVRVMDGLNRFRFADQGEVLAEWESASNVFGPVHLRGEKSGSQEVTPPSSGEAAKAA